MCSSASSGKSSPTPPAARITSRPCGAAATCCGSHRKKRQKSRPKILLGIFETPALAGVFVCGDPFYRPPLIAIRRGRACVVRGCARRRGLIVLIVYGEPVNLRGDHLSCQHLNENS